MRGLPILILCFLTAVLGAACSKGPVTDNASGVIPDPYAEKVAARMQSKSNPYAGQYDARDMWIARNLQQTGYQMNGMPDSWAFGGTYATSEGYLLPWAVILREKHEAMKAGAKPEFSNLLNLPFAGEDEPASFAAAEKRSYEIAGAYFNTIPAWVGQHEGYSAIFPPNGEVLIRSEAADVPLGDTLQGGCCGSDSDTVWSRYSASGELLDTFRGSLWCALYIPGLRDSSLLSSDVRAEFKADKGLFVLRSRATGNVLRVIRYDGSEADLAELDQPVNLHHFMEVPLPLARKLLAGQSGSLLANAGSTSLH